MKWVWVIIFIAGCATNAQRQYNQIRELVISANNSWGTCTENAKNTEVGRRLQVRFIMSDDDARTVEKLATRDYPTEQETRDLVEFLVLRKPCQDMILEQYSNVNYQYINVWATLFMRANTDAAKVLNGELTVGEVNQRFIERNAQFKVEFARISNDITYRLITNHQYELTERDHALQSLQLNTMQLQMSIDAMQRRR